MNPTAELPATAASFVPARLQRAVPVWLAISLWGSAAIALLDAALLQRKYNFFTGGFLTPVHLESLGQRIAFLSAALAINGWLVVPLSAVGLLVASRLRLRSTAARFLAFSAGVLPLALADFFAYEIWAYLGGAFDFDVLFTLSGWRPSEVLAVTAPLLARPALLTVIAAAWVVIVTWLLHRFSRRANHEASPQLYATLREAGISLLLSSVVVATAGFSDEAMQWGLRKLPSAQPLIRAYERLSDFDGDGVGLWGRLSDPAPFTASIHPFALDIPGNGIDEDGVGGDLPLARASYRELPPPAAPWVDHPPVILFVLESFRPDAIGTRYETKEVTPVLDRLAREGLSVDSAWSHNGFTSQSRFHVLTGSLANLRQGTSLLDDFKNQGYEVAYFSAQDDSFGDMPIRYDRVDTFYDARQDVDKRYTTYATPGSLAIPATLLEKRVGDFLTARRAAAPLFLYVNFHDTHYPYVYRGLDNLLGTELLTPRLIAPNRRDELWATYLNTAANVDRGIGRVLDAVTAHTGKTPAVLVVSDHGESLFDEGFLGHGYALNDSQTRVPLIVANLPMKVRIPFGQVDLRDAVNNALAGANGPLTGRPSLEEGNRGRVFQYVGPLDAPAQISWLTSSGRLIYDFRTDRVWIGNDKLKPDALSPESQEVFRDLIFTWEAMRIERERRR
jgi:hypothetical protein